MFPECMFVTFQTPGARRWLYIPCYIVRQTPVVDVLLSVLYISHLNIPFPLSPRPFFPSHLSLSFPLPSSPPTSFPSLFSLSLLPFQPPKSCTTGATGSGTPRPSALHLRHHLTGHGHSQRDHYRPPPQPSPHSPLCLLPHRHVT